MAITSKPNDSDSIAELTADALGNRSIRATKLLLTFLDDIVEAIEDLGSRDQVNSAEFAMIASARKRLSLLEDAISISSSENSQLVSEIGQLRMRQSEILARISNLEQLAWR